jgi:hypothetical protein
MAMQLSGSLEISGSIIATAGITGSFSGSATSASFASTLGGLPSSSFAPAATFNTVSQSFATTSGSLSSRVSIIEGQDATTGSNTFTGVQYISQASNAISFTSTASLYTDGGLRVAKDSFVSGTAYFNNITVYGTSSIEYITSSQVNIGSNIITVNTDTPAVRFGGLSVFDSGSTQLTGSIFWDSEKNHWIYSNPSGSSYNSAMLMNGPRNTGSLGDEQGTTFNALMKGQGGDHITSSQMFDDGNTVRIPGALQVTGSILGAGSNTFGSSISSTQQITGSFSSTGSFTVNSSSFHVASNNQVGINTTTPQSQLVVAKTGNSASVEINLNDSGYGRIFAYNRSTATAANLILNDPGGSVGIGTTSPNASLDVASTARFFSAGNWMQFETNVLTSLNNDGAHIRSVISADVAPTYTWKGDTDTGMYTPGANTIAFSAAGVNRITIGAAGAAYTLDVNGKGRFKIDGLSAFGLDILNNNGVRGAGFYNTGGNNVQLYFYNSASVEKIVLDGGTGTAEFASTVTTTGVKFPATQVTSADANTLDDYEEGTWTPTITGSGSNPSVSYSPGNTGGLYTKIGNVVTVTFEVRWSSISGGSGAAVLAGLPFARRNTNLPDGDRLIVDSYNNTLNGLYLIGSIGPNSTNIGLSLVRSANTTIDLLISDLGTLNPSFLRGTVTYFV